jgi:molybdopterin-dependent oxidoreductase iron-sulfur protein
LRQLAAGDPQPGVPGRHHGGQIGGPQPVAAGSSNCLAWKSSPLARIVKVTSPLDHDVTHGHLCVKGRFGFEFVQRRAGES